MHLCIEGLDGVGKSTLVKTLVKKLQDSGKKVFQTSEPGNSNQEASMKIRDLILNKNYEDDIDDTTRENLLALCRHVQYQKTKKYIKENYWVIQDRGWLSGLSYAQANNFSLDEFEKINKHFNPNYQEMFDFIIYLNNNRDETNLSDAQNAKQEFETGDVIESRGEEFQRKVRAQFEYYKTHPKVKVVDIYEKGQRLTPDELADKILNLFKKTIVFIMGNSGCGKSTLEQALLENKNYNKVVSYTTRPIDTEKRKEVEGVHYHFISSSEYEKMRENGKFVQTADYGGNKYASAKVSYLQEGQFITIVVVPSKVQEIKDALDYLDFNYEIILFDISEEKIRENLKKDGLPQAEIDARFERGNLVDEFNACNLKATFTVKDEDLNENLFEKVKNHLES